MSLDNLSHSETVSLVLQAGKTQSVGRKYISQHELIVWQCISEVSTVLCTGFLSTVAYWSLITEAGWLPDFSVLVLPAVFVAALTGVFALTSHSYNLIFISAAAYRWAGVIALAKATAVLTIVLFAFKVSDTVSRGGVGLQFCSSLIGVLAVRGLFWKFITQEIANHRLSTERVIVVGDISTRDDVLRTLERRGSTIVDTLSFGDNFGTGGRHIVDTCRTQRIERVIVRAEQSDIGTTATLVGALVETPSTVEVVPLSVDMVCPLAIRRAGEWQPATIILRNNALSDFDLMLKRVFDVSVASTALIFFAPIFAATAIAIRLEDRGPVLLRQTRHGYGNRPISIYKFRSMRVVENGATAQQATRNDPRITKVGRFIRRTNIDELPQLINVIAGDMSIVGPRPHPVALNDAFSDQIRLFHRRHNIKPGMTGWAQVNGLRGETDTIEKMQQRVEHDIWYIANWSFLLDLRIVLLTAISPQAYKNAR